MSDFNIKKNPLKIVIVGPQKVGKTVIANSLSEFSQTVSPDYHPTVGVRILELEKPYTDEQIANIPVLSGHCVNVPESVSVTLAYFQYHCSCTDRLWICLVIEDLNRIGLQ